MAAVRQGSFAAGELARSMWGRTDLDRYQAGLRRMFNAFASRQGNVLSRPGTEYLGTAVASKVRLIEFAFSDTDTVQNYVIEFSVESIRVRSGDTVVAIAVGPVPYAEADLPKIRQVQSGDVLVLACVGHPPATLSRQPIGGVVHWIYAPVVSGTSLAAYDAAHAYSAGDMVNSGANYIALQDNTGHALDEEAYWFEVVTLSRPTPGITPYIDVTDAASPGGVAPLGDSRHPEEEWEWTVTELKKGPGGIYSETGPVKVIGANLGHNSTFGTNLGNSGFWNSATTYKQGDAVNYNGEHFESLVDANTNHAPVNGAWWWSLEADINPDDPWLSRRIYNYGTIIKVASTGFYYQSLQFANCGHDALDADGESGSEWWVNLGAPGLTGVTPVVQTSVLFFAVYPDRQVKIGFLVADTSVDGPSNPNFVAFRIYRGRNGVMGQVGDSTGWTWPDGSNAPDFDSAPPQGLNPFEVKDDDGTLLRTETPIACAFFEDRLFFLGTPERPNYGFGSATGDYFNFDQRLVAVDDEAITFGISSRKREVARAAVGVDKLFVFTGSNAWAVGGSDGPLAPDATPAHVAVPVGAEWVEPLVLSSAILWVRDKGTGVRSMVFDSQADGFKSSDLSVAAEDFFRGYQVVDWAWQEDPWMVAWAARSDGVLLSMTYSPEDGVWAWGQHQVLSPDTGAAAVVQSVCVIPEGDEDAVYLAINGPEGQNARVLRFSTRIEAPTKTPVCLDAYLEVDGEVGAETTTFAGLNHLEGRTVLAVELDTGAIQRTASAGGDLVVTGGQVEISGALGACAIGLAYDVEVQLLDLAEAKDKQKAVSRVTLELSATGTVQAGADFDHLFPYAVAAGQGIAKVQVAGKWGTDGAAAIRVSDPIPFTLRGATREVDIGSR